MKPTVTNAIAQSPCRLPCISVGPLQVGVGCALIGETSYEDECPTHRSAPGRLGHHVGRSRVSLYSCRNRLLRLGGRDNEELAVEVGPPRGGRSSVVRWPAPRFGCTGGVVDDLPLDDPMQRHSCELSIQRPDPRKASLAISVQLWHHPAAPTKSARATGA